MRLLKWETKVIWLFGLDYEVVFIEFMVDCISKMTLRKFALVRNYLEAKMAWSAELRRKQLEIKLQQLTSI